LNIPNLLSILRILLLPGFIYYMADDNAVIELLTLTIIGALSDILDGYLARKWNQVTELGKILDPLADKICIAGIGAGVVLYRDFPLWALIVIIMRDVIILLFAAFIMRKRELVPVSNTFGKITVAILSLTLVAYMFRIDFFKEILLYSTLIFLIYSLFCYYRSNYFQSK